MFNIGEIFCNIRDRVFKAAEYCSERDKMDNYRYYEATYNSKIRKNKPKNGAQKKKALNTKQKVELTNISDTPGCSNFQSNSYLREASKSKKHNQIKPTGPKLRRRNQNNILPSILVDDKKSKTTYSIHDNITATSNREEFKNKEINHKRLMNNNVKVIQQNSSGVEVENKKGDDLKTRRKIFTEQMKFKNNNDVLKKNVSCKKDDKLALGKFSNVTELLRGPLQPKTLQNPEVYGVYNTISKLKLFYKDKCTNELDEKGNCCCNACGAMHVIHDSMKRPLPFEVYEETRTPQIKKKMPRKKVSRMVVSVTPDSDTPQVSPEITPEPSFWQKPGSSTQPDANALRDIYRRLKSIEDRLSVLEENYERKTSKKNKTHDTFDMYTQCSPKNSRIHQQIDASKRRETRNKGVQTDNKKLDTWRNIRIRRVNHVDSFDETIDHRNLNRLRSAEWTSSSESESDSSESIEVSNWNRGRKRNDFEDNNKILYYNSSSNFWKTSEYTTDFNSIEIQVSKRSNKPDEENKPKTEKKKVKHSNIAYAFVRNLQKALKINKEKIQHGQKKTEDRQPEVTENTTQGKEEIIFKLPWSEFVNMFKEAEDELQHDSSESTNSLSEDDQFICRKLQLLDVINKRLTRLKKWNKEYTENEDTDFVVHQLN